MLKIASRYWSKNRPVYVAQVKGDGGKDWGYTDDYRKALPLTPYWQRRFAADCRYVGTVARFTDPIAQGAE